MPQHENPTAPSRREMISSAILASTALTIGLLGISTPANAAGPPHGTAAPDPSYPNWEAIREKYFGKNLQRFKPGAVSVGVKAERADELVALRQKLIDLIKNNALFNTARASGGDTFQSTAIKRIESTLADTPDFHTGAKALRGTFLPTHVDILLNQASELLERAISDRSKWDDLSMKNLLQTFDLNQFLDLDQIHLQETDHQFNALSNGIYDQDHNSIKNQMDVETLNNGSLTVAKQFYADFMTNKWSQAVMDKIVADYLQAIKLDHPASGANTDTIAGNYQEVFANSIANQFASNIVQQNSIELALSESNAKLKLLASSMDWISVNKDFQFKRANVARKYQYLKIASNTDEDGILNYQKRAEPLKGRFEEDFRNAYARLLVCADGLDLVFGYDVPLPDPQTTKKVYFFDNCLTWCRQAINFFNRFTRIDQSYVLPISLRNLVQTQVNTTYNLDDEKTEYSNESWDKAIQTGVIQVKIDENLFPHQYHVRVKGVNVFLDMKPRRKRDGEVDKVNGYIIADIDAPKQSYYTHIASPAKRGADQARIPRLRMGRLGTRNFIRNPETGGTSIFYNISPFGDWTITLPQVVDPPKGAKLTDLVKVNDIYLDLIITVRMVKDQNI